MSESYWCKTSPNVPRVWSPSSLSTLASCARKFEYRYVEGWTSVEESLDFAFGTAWHAVLRSFFIANRLGWGDREECIDFAVQIALLFTDLPEPVRSTQIGKTRIGLIRCLIEYVDSYDDSGENILEIDGELALEVPFSFALPLINSDGEPYFVRGFMDMIRFFAGAETVTDFKSTNKEPGEFYFRKFEINFQNVIYSAASQVLGREGVNNFLIDAASITQTGVTHVARHPIAMSPGAIEEGLQDVVEYIRLAEYYASRNYWPKNPESCVMCEFQPICKMDPKLRLPFLQSNFVEKRRTSVE